MGAGSSIASAACCCLKKPQHLSDIQGEPINLQEEFEKFTEQDYLLHEEGEDNEFPPPPPRKERSKKQKRDYK